MKALKQRRATSACQEHTQIPKQPNFVKNVLEGGCKNTEANQNATAQKWVPLLVVVNRRKSKMLQGGTRLIVQVKDACPPQHANLEPSEPNHQAKYV